MKEGLKDDYLLRVAHQGNQGRCPTLLTGCRNFLVAYFFRRDSFMFTKKITTPSNWALVIFWACLLLGPTFSFGDGGQVNLNTATVEQLEMLPGIGPDLARRILDYRADNGPYQNIDGLLNVKGIGEGKLAKIRDMVTVNGTDDPTKGSIGTAN